MKAHQRQRERLPLDNGDRLTQREFHRRYQTYPEGVKIELVGGTVYVASPLSLEHSDFTEELGYWLGTYRRATPGVQCLHNATTILGEHSEPQPDLALRILPAHGGQTTEEVGDHQRHYVKGAPELVIEVAASTRALDLNQKRRDYRFAGAAEYLVVCVEEREPFWFHFTARRRLRPDPAGVWRSRTFPGLWLDGPGLLALDSQRVAAVLARGLATPEHVAFVERLRQPR